MARLNRLLLALFCLSIAAQDIFQGPVATLGTATTLGVGLSNYWAMEECSTNSRVDCAGSQPLTPAGVPCTNGIIANAALFTAGTGGVWLEGSTGQITGDIDFTFAAWVYAAGTNGTRIISKIGPTTSEYDLFYNAGNDNYTWRVFTNGVAVVDRRATTFGSVASHLNEWHLIIAWHDSVANTCNICVDAGTVDSVANVNGVTTFTNPFRIGNGNSAGMAAWNGRIDEVGYWKRVLTAAERTEMYNAGVGRTCAYYGF